MVVVFVTAATTNSIRSNSIATTITSSNCCSFCRIDKSGGMIFT